MIGAFHDEYQSRFGNRFEGFPVEGVTYRVQLIVDSQKVAYPGIATGDDDRGRRPTAWSSSATWTQRTGTSASTSVRISRAGNVVVGPAIIREPMSTTHVVAGQRATVGAYGELVIERSMRLMETVTTPRLRDLSDAEFESRYSCDRFTASVLGKPLPLHRQAHVHAPDDERVQRHLARLVRLRRHCLRAAVARLPDVRRLRQPDALHRRDVRRRSATRSRSSGRRTSSRATLDLQRPVPHRRRIRTTSCSSVRSSTRASSSAS